MIRARLWFRCAALHDPVTPRLVGPSVIGWMAKNRRVDLTIERDFTGTELLKRMKGWITVSPKDAIEVFEKYGRLKTFDDGELVIEVESEELFEILTGEIREKFKDQVDLERV